jgi:hypothetical protein
MNKKGSGFKAAAQVVFAKTDGLLVQVINLLGEGEVLGCHGIARIVGRQAEMHRAITDVDVRVMIRRFGQPADLKDQAQRLDEIGARDGARQGVAGLGPAFGNGLRHSPTLGPSGNRASSRSRHPELVEGSVQTAH